jgi:hypothetical protein
MEYKIELATNAFHRSGKALWLEGGEKSVGCRTTLMSENTATTHAWKHDNTAWNEGLAGDLFKKIHDGRQFAVGVPHGNEDFKDWLYTANGDKTNLRYVLLTFWQWDDSHKAQKALVATSALGLWDVAVPSWAQIDKLAIFNFSIKGKVGDIESGPDIGGERIIYG